jgi:hypothetical protein
VIYNSEKNKNKSHTGSKNLLKNRYSEICDISAFYFGADFPFNIVLYDDIHYLWVTMQPVMNILLNLFT